MIEMGIGKTDFTYKDPWGSEHGLALVRTTYQMTGNLAVEALVADRNDEEYGQTWCSVTVNLGSLPDDDLAFLDTNNMGCELVAMLDALGVYEYTGIMSRSGYCEYPLVRFAQEALEEMGRR